MSKYLAVIKDSFREAFASRVFWLLLIAITVVLALLAPFGFYEVKTTKLTDDDLRDPWELLDRIRKEGQTEQLSPARRVWTLMDEKYRTRLANAKLPNIDREQGNPFEAIGVFRDFRREMNKLIERPDFVDRDYWKGVPILPTEANVLLDRHRQKKLTAAEIPRFNRLMIEAGFSGMIRESPPTSVQWRYGWMDFGSPDPLTGEKIHKVIQDKAAWVLKWLVGVVGVLVAILVTSPIIPQMFDQGSLHLLLSKPVSRWMLLVAKFVGGCAFILLSATYLIVGLWLILGVRFGIWESRLLLSIPIYLFVFTIYYSVSSLAGVIWRSPIVSVAMSVLFWLVCFVLGWALWIVNTAYLHKNHLVQVIEAQDTVIGTNEMGWSFEWDKTANNWHQIFTSNDQRSSAVFLRASPSVPREFRIVGPVYDKSQDRLVAAVPVFPSRVQNLAVGQRASKWDSNTKTTAPLGTSKILVDPSGRLLFVGNLGLYRLTGDPLAEKKPLKLFGMNLPLPSGGPLQEVNPDPALLVTAPSDAAINDSTGELAVYTRSTITVLTPSKSRYVKRIDRKLEGEERQAAVIGFGGQHLALGRHDGRVQILDAASLKSLAEYQPHGSVAPRFIQASPDGRWFSILFHNGRLSLYDAQRKTMSSAPVAGQGEISASNFTRKRSLFVVDRGDRVSEYNLESFKLERRLAPSMNFFLWAYRYAVVPMYVLFPKPSELDKTFDHVLSGKKTKSVDPTHDLVETRETIDPWTPVWSSAVFTLVVLLGACVYIQFQEF